MKSRYLGFDPRVKANLTPREMQVAILFAKGLAAKQIAADVGLSQKTVHTHLLHVQEWFNAGNRHQLLLILLGANPDGDWIAARVQEAELRRADELWRKWVARLVKSPSW